MKRILFLISLFLLCALPAFAKFDPAFTWSTLETPHFSIEYHQGEEELAKRVAVIAEDVHERLVPRIKWEPSGRTHLVLVDSVDDVNGLATVFPYKIFTLYITQPLGEPGFGTMAYDEWMRTLITHEYTHILHLDMVNGVPSALQYVLGRLYFPNQFEPIWMIEGLATYEETEQTSGGRGRSPGSEMVIRMAVLEDKFPRMSQAATFPDFWPSGEVPYLFGEGFSRYIAEKYGREKLADTYVRYSNYGIPWFVDLNGKTVLGEWYGNLWNDWQAELRTRYEKVRDSLSAQGLTASFALTHRGFFNVAPAVSPDGKLIAYTVSNADEFPAIYLMNSDGTGDRKLVENATSSTSSGRSIAWSPEGNGIYYTKEELSKNTNLYNDIYYFDLKRKKEFRITKGLRARDPYPSPDGKNLVFVTNKLGKMRLAVAELPADFSRAIQETDVTWLSGENANQYETPRFSPDGAELVVGVRQPGGYKDIWILDAQGNTREELMHDRAVDGGAVWSPDGRFIYFTSDRTGIFNLYAYERATKTISQVTNVLGGAFTPAPTPDGKAIVFASYSAAGYDLLLLPANSVSWKQAAAYLDTYPTVTYQDKPVETTTRSYNPLPTLVPRFWIPWTGFSEESGSLLGFMTFGQDAVERHSYTLTGLYSRKTHRNWYGFNYAYDGIYPTIEIEASDIDGTFSGLLTDPTGSINYVQKEKTEGASLVLPLFRMQKQHLLTIGYRQKNIAALTALPPWPGYTGPLPAEGRLTSGRVSYLFNNARQYNFSISPEDGRTIYLGYEKSYKALGGDFTITKYTADWHEYLDLPGKHHVLQARVFGGTSTGDVTPQGAFQLGGDNPGNTIIPVDSEYVYLRGYPVNEYRGSKAALASLEYRFPVVDVETGMSNAPVFFRRLHGAVFAEAGNAWDNGFRGSEFKRAVGAEARFDMTFSYFFPVTFRLVIAKALDDKKDSLFYLSLWSPGLF